MNNFLHELENAVINENHKVTKEEATIENIKSMVDSML